MGGALSVTDLDVCTFCNVHRHSMDDPADDVCEHSPTGYHDVPRLPHWTKTPKSSTADRSMVEWALESFSSPVDRDDDFRRVPVGLRRALTRLFHCYPNMPKGSSDPMYFANVIGSEMGFGDGFGEFAYLPPRPNQRRPRDRDYPHLRP